MGSTQKKWDDIFQLIDTHKLDVLLIQEAREVWNEIRGFTAKLKQDGWKVFIGDSSYNSAGGKNNGVITLSRWPMKKAISPVAMQNPDRILCTWLSLRGRRPIRINNIYLHSSNREDACDLGERILNECAEELA